MQTNYFRVVVVDDVEAVEVCGALKVRCGLNLLKLTYICYTVIHIQKFLLP